MTPKNAGTENSEILKIKISTKELIKAGFIKGSVIFNITAWKLVITKPGSSNRVSIFDAVKMSFRACLGNMLPFFIYGLACLGILIVAVAVIGGIAVLLGMMLEEVGIIVGIIGMIIMIFAIIPVFIASTFAAYKDIFYTR